jgi:phosphatidylinositol glycan class M
LLNGEQTTTHSFGLAVHFKIYPIIYSLAIFLSLDGAIDDSSWSRFWSTLMCSWRRWRFALLSASTFVVVTSLCYLWFGDKFLQETYLYHLSRQDPRHNFAVHFYYLYLNGAAEAAAECSNGPSITISLLPFLPQLLLIVIFSLV